MSLEKPADKVIFVSDDIEEKFNSLPKSYWLKKAIEKLIENLKQNTFCGKNIPKRQIPKKYIQKYQIDNLYWYPLPNAWRLTYSLIGNKTGSILAVILGWSDHKNYERLFKY